jgi:hypothetical protein
MPEDPQAERPLLQSAEVAVDRYHDQPAHIDDAANRYHDPSEQHASDLDVAAHNLQHDSEPG